MFAEEITEYLNHIHHIEEIQLNSLGFAADWGRVTSIEHLFRLSNLYLDGDISKVRKVTPLNKLDNISKAN